MTYMTHLNEERFEVDFWFGSQFDSWFRDFRESDARPGLFETTVMPYGWYVPEIGGEAEPPQAFGEAICFFASKAFVDLLEQLEPGVHSYAKFELRYGPENGDYTSHDYYAVRPVEFAGVDSQASQIEWRNKERGIWKKIDGVPLTFDSDVIKGKHLWNRISGYCHRFISDELHDAIKHRGMTTSWLFEKQIVKDKQTLTDQLI